jgi:hypothetical protein
MAKTRKEQKDKQRSTEHYPETRNWATRTYKNLNKENKLGWTSPLMKCYCNSKPMISNFPFGYPLMNIIDSYVLCRP